MTPLTRGNKNNRGMKRFMSIFYVRPGVLFWPCGAEHPVRSCPVIEKADSQSRVYLLQRLPDSSLPQGMYTPSPPTLPTPRLAIVSPSTAPTLSNCWYTPHFHLTQTLAQTLRTPPPCHYLPPPPLPYPTPNSRPSLPIPTHILFLKPGTTPAAGAGP